MDREYQRRTQKGMGRTEKTGHNCAAKNPRLLKACNITAKRDMGEFFFISISSEFCYKIPFSPFRRTVAAKADAKLHIFLKLRGLKYDFYVNFVPC